MRFEFNFAGNKLRVNGKQQRTLRPGQFLFLLHHYAQKNLGMFTKGDLERYMPDLDDRTQMSRVLDKFEELGLAGHVMSDNETTGPWWIDKDSPHEVVFKLNGRDTDADTIFSRLFPEVQPIRDRIPVGFAVDEATLSDAAILIAYGDQRFAAGDLDRAEDHYDRALDGAQQSDEALTFAIAAQRLLQVYRRIEDHKKMLRLRKRLEDRADKIPSEYFRNFLSSAAELYSVWHLYAAKQDYPEAKRKLEQIDLKDLVVPSLRIEWLNLKALIDRRLLLEALDAGSSEDIRELLEESIAHLKQALHECLLFNAPYHAQQVSANFANILALYLGRVPEYLDEPPADTQVQIVRLLSFSNVMAELFALGKDDMYNSIYLLSIARRFGLTAKDLTRLWNARPWPVPSATVLGVPNLTQGLAAYGDEEFRRVGDGHRTFGPEQQALLAFEICWAAVGENRLDIFKRYVETFVDKSWDKETEPLPVAARYAKRLRDHIAVEKRAKGDWHAAAVILESFERNIIPGA